jgi:hypothetical protein
MEEGAQRLACGRRDGKDWGTTMARRCYFGDIARVWGYATAEQVLTALNVQRARREGGMGHRFIGDILVDLGLLSDAQRNEILDAQAHGVALDRTAPAL